MKRWLNLTLVLTTLLLTSPHSVSADGGLDPNPTQPEALCPPGVYLDQKPEGCLLLGPAGYFTQRAFIERELANQDQRFKPLNALYGKTDYNYLKINEEGKRRLFRTLEDAVAGENPISTFPGGFSYAAYIQEKLVDGKVYYQLTNRYWIRGADVIRQVTPTLFRGVEVLRLPTRPFGWVLFASEAHTRPGWNTPMSGHTLDRHELIEVFEVKQVGGYDWYLVSPGEWLEQRRVALVYPGSKAPHGVTNGRWIEINLFEQTTAVYQNGKLIFATLTTSGSPDFYTRPGLFKITEKLLVTHMAGGEAADGSDKYYLEKVPWTMYFDQRRALHAEYWHDRLGYKSSHGCANLSFADAEWLFNWAEVGDWVYVWDPSGQTPVIPRLFTHLLEAEMDKPPYQNLAD